MPTASFLSEPMPTLSRGRDSIRSAVALAVWMQIVLALVLAFGVYQLLCPFFPLLNAPGAFICLGVAADDVYVETTSFDTSGLTFNRLCFRIQQSPFFPPAGTYAWRSCLSCGI